MPILGSEESIPQKGSLQDHLKEERAALEEITAWLETSPLWRRVDREQVWLCPLCGMLQEDVRILNLVNPGVGVARNIRRHLLERCIAWRSSNRTPLAASVLDARLQQINDRKASASTERTLLLSRQVEGLQERVEEMEHLERDVRKAQRRQLHMLPIDPEPDEIAEVAVAYRPAQAIGGDFIDFYPLVDNRYGVTIGDVSGHGVEAAILMGIAKKALRIRVQETVTAREAMEYANRDLHEELRSTAFVTAFFAGIDRSSRRMTYVRAGHPPPLLRRAARGCENLGSGGLPLGVDGGQRFNAGLEERELELHPGDILLLYTDGVTEAGSSASEFGIQRLRQALMDIPPQESAEKIVRTLMAGLDSFLAGAPQDDDVTMICLKIQ